MLGKKLINAGPVATGGGANTFASENFETVTYTGNGGTQRIGGYINRGAVFNGSSSYIQVNSIPTNDTFSLSFWINATDPNSDSTLFHFYDSGNHIAANTIGIANAGTLFGWFPHTSTGGAGFTGISASDTNALFDGSWHNVVIVSDANSFSNSKIYIDGVEKTLTISNSYTTSVRMEGALYFGRRQDGANDYNGKIDQVRLFNKALSSSEVTTLYGETYASSTVSTTDIFDDNSGVALYQLDGNANDTGGVSGKFGSAAIFNGSSSKIEVPSKSFTSSTNWSLSYWINWSTSPTSKQYVYYFGNYNLRIEGQSGLNKIVFWDGSAERIVSNAVSLNNWQHITYTYNGTTLTMYVNGSSVDTLSVTSSPVSTSVQETIGAAYDGSGRFNGKLDDIRIYDDVLTSTEVGYIYNNTTASIPTDNLQAYYKLDGDARDEQQLYDGTATNVSYAYDGTATNVTYQEATKFQPDLVWVKKRSSATSSDHQLNDSVRGVNKIIYPNLTNAEDTAGGVGSAYLNSFDSNGFTVGSSTYYNGSAETYVAWCFKGGGTAVTDSSADITADISANTDAGFSIVKYTGNGSTNQTIPHGLNSSPTLIITKCLNDGTKWWGVNSTSLTTNTLLRLDSTSAEISDSGNYITMGNTSTFTVQDGSIINGSLNYIAYCFHSVDGYSKIGSYTGNFSASGPIVETGFEPQFIMIKRADVAGNWFIFDNERSTTNERDDFLHPNSSAAETTNSAAYSVDFLSNGFQIKGNGDQINGNNGTHIYLAIAADPDTTTPTVENSFDVVTYTGNGSSNDISTDFKPDLVWLKNRTDSASSHRLYDSITYGGPVADGGTTYYVKSDVTDAQSSSTNTLTSLNSDGFSLYGTGNNTNANGDEYVAWCWKAGDHDDNLPQINTEGSIDSVVSVNAAAGFSIVKYTGGNSASDTVGTGLSSSAEMIILKDLDDGTNNWRVWHKDLTTNYWLYLNLTNSQANAATDGGLKNVNANTFGFINGTTDGVEGVNSNSSDYIAYCFHSVSGYQKIGSYTGNTSTLPSVNLGFSPRFVMIKETTDTGSWLMYDNVRPSDPVTQNDKILFANDSSAESTSAGNVLNFTSTGFDIEAGSSELNTNGNTYIYLAIA